MTPRDLANVHTEDHKLVMVIGYIDAYGAIHHKAIRRWTIGTTHGHFWPIQTHKTWRFVLSDWQLENSVLSKDNLTPEESLMVIDFIRKRFTPPLWLLEGEEWDALGRPRSGKKYEEHCRKWEKLRAEQE